ncbi:hypothetical protein DAPPUDRAFT_254419 [Daphnia pulex]|uniref:6-phosphogluconate dehydrogenase NADP-binding domain-containing protein n=1 Tax=Daphnia pulex TaxID=6669 RepID=E9H750_DAPPU|nr:hypothetical protein DAPPUDRAFT_254419 [Daphnia pulex]|eukprot:EFX72460.1 hypothetical protein DAPPUDRAFT_254419 [Daphnia pulex]
MKGFSPWPGKIANPPKDLKRISKPAWIEDFNIKPYHEYKEQFTKACKSRAFLDACQAIEKHIVNPPKEEEQVQTVTDDNQSDEDFDKLKDETKEKDSPKKVKRDIKRTPKERKRRTSGESGSDSGPTPSRKKPRSNSTIENSSDTSVITNHTSPRKSGLVSRILDQPATIQRPLQDTPPLDVERVTQTLKEKNVQPSTLKFGFLGLGIMGSGMVKNLLNSGHKVIVWNRTTEKTTTTGCLCLFISWAT